MIIVLHSFKRNDFFSLELTGKCNRMSCSMIPDLLLYGLLNIHSLRLTKYFLFLKLKDIAHTCKQTPELTHLCLNTITPKMTYYVWSDIVSDFHSTSTCWAKIPGILNEKGKFNHSNHAQVKVQFPVLVIFLQCF